MNERLRRVRQPPPLLKRRIPSGRGATEQPNITGEGEGALTGRFWVALALTAVATGLFADLLMGLLFGVQRLAFGGGPGDFLSRVQRAPDARRLASLLVAGALAGPAWYLLRRWTEGEVSAVEEVVWGGGGRLSLRRSFLSGVLSEVVVGMGASLGREAAPKLMGGVSGDLTATWLGLAPGQRRLLVACGAGAGLAAVYNVPIGGALFACELLLGSMALPVVLPAVACSAAATGVAWLYLPQRSTYPGLPDYPFHFSVLLWALAAGPVIGLLASAYIRLIGWVSHHSLSGRWLLAGPLVSFGALGLVGLAYPQLFGNGKGIALRAFTGQGSLWLMLALFALKPLVTALCLGGGATGGLFTPFLSTGAAFGAFAGAAWAHAWPGEAVGAFAVVGAAAMLGAALQAPLAGLVLVLELTHSGFGLMVPIMAATFLASGVAYRVDGYSIYSARLTGAG